MKLLRLATLATLICLGESAPVPLQVSGSTSYKGTRIMTRDGVVGGKIRDEKDEKTGWTVGDGSNIESSDERDDSISSSSELMNDEAANQPEEGEINVKAGKIVDATKDGTGLLDFTAYCSIGCVGCDPPPECECLRSPLPGLGC